MQATRTINFDQSLLEVVYGASAKTSQRPGLEQAATRRIEQMVRQCYALIRQELERRVKQEPGRYRKDRLEAVLRGFRAAIPDIQDAIAQRVQDSMVEMIQLEIRRVLRDALADLATELIGPGSGVAAPDDRAETKDPRTQVGGGSIPTATESESVAKDRVFKEATQVVVDNYGSPQLMTGFLRQLTSNPDLKVLSITGGFRSASVQLALRRPLQLGRLLSELEGVSRISQRQAGESARPFDVLDAILGTIPELSVIPAGVP